ncbi:MAG: 30S ribosomal protein S16 [Candidatus Marinimicrobia bacterium]|nr:30S ribosomal protein S16 [Candidatus Neomarinimicrobiota bacterium]MCF7839232.1 30S ribosomal protein S16 [Candidatus Neomarinimicrobiota bacterium]
MAVRIRLMRMGRKKLPLYRIVVADSKAPRDGRYIEIIGRYNPLPEKAEVVVDESRLFKWLDDGANMSDTVKTLMRQRGLTLKYELIKRNADEATVNKELQKWEMARQERDKRSQDAKADKAVAKEQQQPEAEPEAEVEAAPAPVAEEAPAKAEEVVEPKKEEAAAPEAEAEPVETDAAPETPAEEPEQDAESESKDEK